MLLSHPMSYFIYLHLKGLPNQQKPEHVFTLYNQNLLETKKIVYSTAWAEWGRWDFPYNYVSYVGMCYCEWYGFQQFSRDRV